MSAFHLSHEFQHTSARPFSAVDYVVVWESLKSAADLLHGHAERRGRCDGSAVYEPGGDLVAQLAEDLEAMAFKVLATFRQDESLIEPGDVERRAWTEIKDAVGMEMPEFGSLVATRVAEVYAAREVAEGRRRA